MARGVAQRFEDDQRRLCLRGVRGRSDRCARRDSLSRGRARKPGHIPITRAERQRPARGPAADAGRRAGRGRQRGARSATADGVSRNVDWRVEPTSVTNVVPAATEWPWCCLGELQSRTAPTVNTSATGLTWKASRGKATGVKATRCRRRPWFVWRSRARRVRFGDGWFVRKHASD